jgi:tetratricopeptide (TPR) repeat protein
MYFDYLRSGDARPLKNVFYHNAMDVLSMAALLNHLAQLLDNPLNGQDPHGIDLIAIGKLYEDLGEVDSAAECYLRGLGKVLPEEIRSDAIKRWSMMEKRRGNWEKAIELWSIAVERSELYAFEELAKFYEHHLKDYSLAAYWTRSAIETLTSLRMAQYERAQFLGQFKHRLERLLRKSE